MMSVLSGGPTEGHPRDILTGLEAVLPWRLGSHVAGVLLSFFYCFFLRCYCYFLIFLMAGFIDIVLIILCLFFFKFLFILILLD